MAAARTLGRTRSREAVAALLLALGDRSPQVRRCAVKALGRLGFASPRVRSALALLLKDPDPGVARTARGVLRSLRSR